MDLYVYAQYYDSLMMICNMLFDALCNTAALLVLYYAGFPGCLVYNATMQLSHILSSQLISCNLYLYYDIYYHSEPQYFYYTNKYRARSRERERAEPLRAATRSQ